MIPFGPVECRDYRNRSVRQREPNDRVADTLRTSDSDCDERDRLKSAYREAFDVWMTLGGPDPTRTELPAVIAAKNNLDHVALKLIDHRAEHDC
jgi:hypothetical protein